MQNFNYSEKTYSIDEFNEMAENSPERLEYRYGYIYAMAEPTRRHRIIARNCLIKLQSLLDDKGYDAFLEAMVSITDRWGNILYQPNVLVDCTDKQAKYNYLTHPGVIIEVLSDSNTNREITQKIGDYFKIKIVTNILVISQTHIHVSHFNRDGENYRFHFYEDIDDLVIIKSLNIQFKVSDIYKSISF